MMEQVSRRPHGGRGFLRGPVIGHLRFVIACFLIESYSLHKHHTLAVMRCQVKNPTIGGTGSVLCVEGCQRGIWDPTADKSAAGTLPGCRASHFSLRWHPKCGKRSLHF